MVAFNISQHCRHHYGSIIFSTPAKTWNLISIWSSQWWMKHWSVHKIHRPALKQCISLIGSGSGVLFQKPNPPPQEETFLSYMFWQKLLCRALIRNWAESVDSWGLGATLSFFVPLSALSVVDRTLLWFWFKSVLKKQFKIRYEQTSAALQLNYSRNNLSQQQLEQDVSARWMSCSCTLQCWSGLEGKKSVRFQRVLGKQK